MQLSGPTPTPTTEDASGPSLERRTLLRASGAAGAAGVVVAALAACSSSSSTPAAASSGALASPSDTSNESSPSASASASASAGGGTGTSLGAASQVPVGGGMVFAAQKVVVTQPTAGTYKAFSSTCTHMGCQVNQIADGKIKCPCHGSQYSITDGSVQAGPAPSPLPAEKVTVQGGQLFLSS